MSQTDPLQPADQITFARDCEATQIPSGNKMTMSRGTAATVTQTLGGNITLHIPALGILVQISGHDANALLKEGTSLSEIADAKVLPAMEKPKVTGLINENTVWETLKTCYDPEIPVNIVDLGLVYDMKISPASSGTSRIDVKMTLTARGCGMGAAIAGDAQTKLLNLPGIEEANVELVWDPPWNPSMISEEGKHRLGIA